MDPNMPSVIEAVGVSPWYADFLLVLAGGVAAALGGLLTTMYQARVARRVKFEEVMGEQKAKALGKAMRLMNALSSILIQGAEKDVLDYIHQNNEWMLDNEPLLPQKAAENWHSIRHITLSMIRKDERQRKMEHGAERDQLIQEIGDEWQYTRELAKEAEALIRTEFGLAPFKVHRRQRA